VGRPYAREMAQLPGTYAFARLYDVSEIQRATDQLRHWPLVIVGSGGSVSAGELAMRLHVAYAGLPASVLTPLEFIRRPVPDDSAVLLLSASGRNPDILAAARHAVSAECQVIAALLTRPGSPLARQLRAARHALVLEVAGPVRSDGFLATNSLLLSSALLLRSYGAPLPSTLPSFEGEPDGYTDAGLLREILTRQSVVALASNWALPAAVDLESRWGESGLAPITVLDPRNFAHGRHTGLARRHDATFVLGMAAGEDRVLEETLGILPPQLSVGLLQSRLSGPAGGLDLIARVIQLTGPGSADRGFDAGRPVVPAFGRQLYRAGIHVEQVPARATSTMDLWIRRKVTTSVWRSVPENTRDEWRAVGEGWRQRLCAARFGAVILDYDGTLCEESERRSGPAQRVGRMLIELLRAGVRIGVATGRGKSVIASMRQALPRDLWGDVCVGMYNGALLTTLSGDDDAAGAASSAALSAAAVQLQASPTLRAVAVIDIRDLQLTVRERQPMPDGLLCRMVHEALGPLSTHALRILTSGGTVDVLDACASKAVLVEYMRSGATEGREVLRIGDQGQFGGNDHALLAHPFGLSVDRVSTDLANCWNVAPVGARRTEALLAYLRALHVASAGYAIFRSDKIRRLPVKAGVLHE
jgi:D-arabinose 5-phosphate isomerase GutQ